MRVHAVALPYMTYMVQHKMPTLQVYHSTSGAVSSRAVETGMQELRLALARSRSAAKIGPLQRFAESIICGILDGTCFSMLHS